MAMRTHMKGDCSSDFALPGNYPLGSMGSARYASLEKVQELLRNYRDNIDTFVARYFEIYHPIMPLLDPSAFQTSMTNFCNSPEQADSDWLVESLVVLGLGAYASSRDETASAEFFYASEACLAKTAYMSQPTPTIIGALCLMVLAKQVAYATCWALDTCWNVMGVVVRLCMMTVLHQEWMPEFQDPMIVKERERRRRIWTVVVYLDIQLSLITGQQSLLPQDTLVITTEMQDPSKLEECWDSTLPQSFPIICHFLARINSYTDQITYDQVLQYDLTVRQLTQHVTKLPGSDILRLTLDIFFRRVLLVLHRRHALDPEAALLYPTSYWTSLDCSLAMMVHHRDIYDMAARLPNIDLIGRLYMLDFFATALTVCIHLLRSDAPLATASTTEGTMPPRQTILSTLKNCLDIFSKDQNKSLCFRTGHPLLKAVFELLPKE
ncbi:hypothetical protein N0V83_000269 [Neocucurbitaria cava]|uniref:Xylanolytic transcriptional activator regulatory domain-containing protein n=1 Tax=Neocucurbitaria cava TaxID=798079 RepID=A0A9W8YGC0_9PLEO|nr:hypothetical protein N0V83_000269 [Neocucurbitaria cava]